MGQWTNRLYEYFRQPERQVVCPKRLATSLRKRHQQGKQQVGTSEISAAGSSLQSLTDHCAPQKDQMFLSSDSERAVASSQDDTIELTMFRQNGSQSRSASNSESHMESPPEEPGLGEIGEVPPLRECYVDGPYGTPTRQIFASEHAVLIGAGIGITPFASILQSIMYRLESPPTHGPSHHWLKEKHVRSDGAGMFLSFFTLQVDFIWINRDQKSFEWFVSLLTKLEMDQADGEPEGQFLEMHMYMTSALSKNDMKAIGLQMALDLLAKKEEKDSITGLRTRTQPGRPQWEKVRLHLHLFVSDPSEPLLMMIHFLIKLFDYFWHLQTDGVQR
ncbi:hypothetical protein GOODEAATRI_029698 [Goodea atripinnis]|uniref:Ferric reductase NAD binding domain-containing protein n=1 Tax=Goodea atripinnis TaxID=208336 RepID=A0ABV0MLU2_9TELE